MADEPLDFNLRDLEGRAHAFPTGRPSLVCFVKEDCQTCNLAAPAIEAFHKRFGSAADVWFVGQSADGNAILKDRHGLTAPILDDSACEVSFAWDFEIVPAVYWTDGQGHIR